MFASRPPRGHDLADHAAARIRLFPLHLEPPSLVGQGYPAGDSLMISHVEAACRYGAVIERMAHRHGLLPSIIAGFGSRQSGWGIDLAPAGPEGCADFTPRLHRTDARLGTLPADGRGFVRGLMRLDYDRHELARSDAWRDPEANIDAACRAIADHRDHLRRRTTLQGTGLMRAAFAAFDCGLEPVQQAVRQGQDVDSPTSSQDYGRDILERAGFFRAHGWD